MAAVILGLGILYVVCFGISLWVIACFTEVIDVFKTALFAGFILFVIVCIILGAAAKG